MFLTVTLYHPPKGWAWKTKDIPYGMFSKNGRFKLRSAGYTPTGYFLFDEGDDFLAFRKSFIEGYRKAALKHLAGWLAESKPLRVKRFADQSKLYKKSGFPRIAKGMVLRVDIPRQPVGDHTALAAQEFYFYAESKDGAFEAITAPIEVPQVFGVGDPVTVHNIAEYERAPGVVLSIHRSNKYIDVQITAFDQVIIVNRSKGGWVDSKSRLVTFQGAESRLKKKARERREKVQMRNVRKS